MTLPASGVLKMSAVETELAISQGTPITLGDSRVETLAGVTSNNYMMGALRGKTNRKKIRYTFDANMKNASLYFVSFVGYIQGKTDLIVTINPGVYLYGDRIAYNINDGSSSPPVYVGGGLNILGASDGDTLTIINNGFIVGGGGNGGILSFLSPTPDISPGGSGGPALCVSCPVIIDNTNPTAYIAGGGGGGGGSLCCGGGGAGSGDGTGVNCGSGGYYERYDGSILLGGSSGGFGKSGGDGKTEVTYAFNNFHSEANTGGGGGMILPGVGGGHVYDGAGCKALGGGAGGGGGSLGGPVSGAAISTPGVGGSANNPGGNGIGNGLGSDAGGGGGGWGAQGGSSSYYYHSQLSSPGGSGGNAIILNGQSVTFINSDSSRVFGAIS